MFILSTENPNLCTAITIVLEGLRFIVVVVVPPYVGPRTNPTVSLRRLIRDTLGLKKRLEALIVDDYSYHFC